MAIKKSTTKKPTKTTAKKEPKKMGRPEKITDEILSKLRQGFRMGFNDAQACLYAEISPVTLWRFLKENEDFRKEKEVLKQNPQLLAKTQLFKKISNSDEASFRDLLDYLKHTARDEFTTRQELTGKDGEDLKAPEITIKIVE